MEYSNHRSMKELNCLYHIGELVEIHGNSIEKILHGVVDLLRVSWQYSEITCSKLILDDKEYMTSNFKTSEWRQVADIITEGKKVGTVEVYYLKKMPIIDEGPFTTNERVLINTVAERIGKIFKRIKQEYLLKERVKELGCFYEMSKLVEIHGNSIEKILHGVVDLLRVSWQYTDITCARIVLEDKEFMTDNFKSSIWKQTSDITISGRKIGVVEVYYLNQMPTIYEGPFLKEERQLIDAIAERIGKIFKRIKQEYLLKERVKELGCFYEMSKLVEIHGNSIEKILHGVVDLLRVSWQYTDITCARIVLEDKEFMTDNFKSSIWKQTSDITISGRKIGVVEVYYLNQMPTIYEGPFLKEERQLIDAIAERIGKVVERIRTNHQLEIERTALENKNIALREILVRIQEEKNEIGNRIVANVDKIIMPIIHAHESETPPDQRGYLRLLKSNLDEITSPFINMISKEFAGLSPVEIQICNLIKSGFTSKEIANLRSISVATVSRHREHIRHKLRISNKNINLTTYLTSYMNE